jgi:hypothetical protein
MAFVQGARGAASDPVVGAAVRAEETEKAVAVPMWCGAAEVEPEGASAPPAVDSSVGSDRAGVEVVVVVVTATGWPRKSRRKKT